MASVTPATDAKGSSDMLINKLTLDEYRKVLRCAWITDTDEWLGGIVGVEQCVPCGEYRMVHSGDHTDWWKHHVDYCPGATPNFTAIDQIEYRVLDLIKTQGADYVSYQYVAEQMVLMLRADIQRGTNHRHAAIDRVLHALAEMED